VVEPVINASGVPSLLIEGVQQRDEVIVLRGVFDGRLSLLAGRGKSGSGSGIGIGIGTKSCHG